MGKYNLGMIQDESYKLTIAELCDEIADENKELDANSPDTLRDKFKNYDRSGLVDKLEDVLNFRIEEFEDKYAQLKLLKYLYYIEKNGQSKKRCNDESFRLKIIDILNKPRLDNIKTSIVSKTEYGVVLSKFKEDISVELVENDRKERNDIISKMNVYWEHILSKTLDYVTAEMPNERREEALIELKRIEKFLKEKVLNKMPDVNTLTITYSEGLFQVIYNKLICHELLCMEQDRLNINYQICIEEEPSEEYVAKFLKYENYNISISNIEKFIKIIDDENCEEVQFLGSLIFDRTNISNKDKVELKSALKYIKVLLEWIGELKGFDVSKNVPVPIFISALQEIIFVKKNKVKFKNDFYGNKYQARSMLAALKKPDTVEAVVKVAWVKKVENRYICNIGTIENFKIRRNIENTIYQIKSKIFGYQNLSDIKLADDTISHFVARTIISREFAMKIGDDFADLVYKQCGYRKFINTNNNIFDFYRELSRSEEKMKEVAYDMGKAVLEYEEEEPEQKYILKCSKGVKYYFNLKLSEKYNRDFLLMYDINFETKTITIHTFYEVVSDEIVINCERIGLEKFIIK